MFTLSDYDSDSTRWFQLPSVKEGKIASPSHSLHPLLCFFAFFIASFLYDTDKQHATILTACHGFPPPK